MGVCKTSKPNKWRIIINWKGQRKDWIFEGAKKDAKAFEAAEKLKMRTQSPRGTSGMPTLMEFCSTGGPYEEHAKLRLRDTTLTARKYVIRDLLVELGDLRLDDINDRVVTRAAHKWLACSKPTTVNCKLRALRAVLNFARNKCGLLIPPPAFEDLAEPQEKRVPKAWTQEQITKLLDTCAKEDPELLPHLVFLANTGCRKGETLHIEWDDVDFDRRIVTLWRTKTGHSREVPMNDILKTWLERLQITFTSAQVKRSRYVFCNQRGDRFLRWPQRRFDLVRKAAGLTGGPHRFRHSYATEHFRQGGHPGELAQFFGASETVIRKTYRHLLPGHMDSIRNRVSFAAGIGPAEAAALRAWGKK